MTTRKLIPDLLPNTQYAIQVRAVGVDSVSEWSQRKTFFTIADTVNPSVPANVTWVVNGDSFHGEWDAVSYNVNGDFIAVNRYEIELVAGGITKVDSVVPATGSSKVTYDLTFEQNIALFSTARPQVVMRVRTVDNKDLKSDWSAPALTATNAVPAAPTAPAVGAVATASNDAISLAWTAVPADTDVVAFNVYVGSTAGFTPSSANRVYSGMANRFTYTTTTYTTQYFKIRAVDKFGQESSDLTANAAATSPFTFDAVAPGVPTSLAATLANAPDGLTASAAVSWALASPPSDLAGFNLRYRRQGSSDNWISQQYEKDVTSVQVSDLVPFTNYEFQVRSFDWAANYSAFSAVVNATSPTNAAPAQVTGLTSTAGRDSIYYTWTESADADVKNGAGVYEIHFSTSNSFPAPIVYKTGAPTLTVSGLQSETTYYTRVRAIDAGGAVGTWSATNTTTTTKGLEAYIQSRGADLITNGTGFLGDNTNFTGFTFDQTDAPVGASGSFNSTLGVTGAAMVSEFIPVDPSKRYKASFYAKQKGTTAGGHLYGMFIPYDAFKQTIIPSQYMYVANTLTTLAAPLNPGDTTITLTSSTNWYGSAGLPAGANIHLRSIIFWDYVDPGGKLWPELTYSRNNTGSNFWADGGITGNVITLAAPYAGPAKPAGTKLSNGSSGGTYMYMLSVSSVVVPTSWTRYSETVQGVVSTGGAAGFGTGWPHGTGFAKFGWLVNRQSSGAADPLSKHSFALVSLSEAGGALYVAENAQATADGKNTVTYSTLVPGATANKAGDIWFQTSGSVIIGQWQGNGGTSWSARTIDNAVIANLDAAKITTGFLSAARLQANTITAASGIIADAAITTAKIADLAVTNAKINDLAVSKLTAGTVGSGFGITMAAGSSILLNGGYIKSNTYTGTSQATNPSGAGFYLGDDGLRIDTGKINVAALETGTISGTKTITLSGANAKIVGTGFELSGAGLTVTNGVISAAALQIQNSQNLLPAMYADFEGTPSGYTSRLAVANGTGTVVTTESYINKQSLRWTTTSTFNTLIFGSNSTDWNIQVEPSKTYIVSWYAKVPTGAIVANLQPILRATTTGAPVGGADHHGGAVAMAVNNTWTRYSTTFTTGSTVLGPAQMYIFNATSGTNVYLDGFQIEEKIGALNTPSVWKPPGSTTIDGAIIRTGSIVSTAIARVIRTNAIYNETEDVIIGYGNPTEIDDPNGRTAWNINAQGNAEFSNLSIRGNVIVGNPSGGASEILTPVSVTFNTTSGSAVVTSATDMFNRLDVGRAITGSGIPVGATVATFTSATSITISANATATATGVVGTIARDARIVSTISSVDYIQGSQGWTIRSDGYSEFRSMAADSLDGIVIRTKTLDASAIKTGIMEADISLSGSFQTSSDPTETMVATTSGSAAIVIDSSSTVTFSSSDIGILVAGDGIPYEAKIISVTDATHATMSANATATATAASIRLYRGRIATLSGSTGLTLTDQYGNDIVKLPTDPGEANYFAGSVEATDLYVKDEFRMFGQQNSLGQNSILNLEGGQYKPATYPLAAFNYESKFLNDSGKIHSLWNDPYADNETGAVYDSTTDHYYWMNAFYGIQLMRAWGPNSGVEGQIDFAIEIKNGLNDGPYDWALGGVCADATSFHFLTKNINTGTWRHQALTRTGVFRSTGPVAGDRVWNHVWAHAQSGGMNGIPALEVHGGNMYVAKLNSNNQIVLYKYTGGDMTATPAIAKNTGIVSSGLVQSLRVGQFDYGTGSNYAVVTMAGTNSSHRTNYVFVESGATFNNTSWSFPTPYDKSGALGTVWIGTSNNDSTGHFKSMLRDGFIYKHTQLGYKSSLSYIKVSQKWRNDGSGGGTVAIGPEGPIGQYTYKKRSKLTLTSRSTIPNVGGNSPNALTFYMGEGTGTRYRYDEPATGVLQQTVLSFRTTDAAGTSTVMAEGVPSKLVSSAGLEINGNGEITATKLTVNGLVTSSYLPDRMYADVTAVTLSSALFGSETVTFPSGYFTVGPKVTATVSGSTSMMAYTSGITSTGFTVGVRRVDGGAALSGTFNVHWQAVQM